MPNTARDRAAPRAMHCSWRCWRSRRRWRAPPSPATPNKGDTAWMLTSTALVLLMSVPALALFYGGLVRTKNMLSVLMQVFVGFSLITVLWCVYGYSLAFTQGNAVIGGLSAGCSSRARSIRRPAPSRHRRPSARTRSLYELVYVGVPGDLRRDHLLPDPRLAGRAHQVLRRAAVPGHLVHLQLLPDRAHGVVLAGPGCLHLGRQGRRGSTPPAGLIWQWGALDFAGGTVVHINAGVAGLVGAYRARQARRLRPRADGAAQPHPDHDRRVAAVVRLVRLQRRLGARGQRLAPRSPS